MRRRYILYCEDRILKAFSTTSRALERRKLKTRLSRGRVRPGNGLLRFFLRGKASSATKTWGWSPLWSAPGRGWSGGRSRVPPWSAWPKAELASVPPSLVRPFPPTSITWKQYLASTTERRTKKKPLLETLCNGPPFICGGHSHELLH